MKRYYRLFLQTLLVVLATSCIENDIPYPTIKLQVTEFAVAGQKGDAQINAESQTITITLEETVQAEKVLVENITYTEGASSTVNIGDYMNLADTTSLTLSLYQDYLWTVITQQPIERLFQVNRQVGETVFDAEAKRVVAYVHPEVNLRKVEISSLKLAPQGATYVPSDLVGRPVDFRTLPVEVEVLYRGEKEIWSLYVEHKNELVSTKSPITWVEVIWMFGEGIESQNRGFEYKKPSDEVWTRVPAEYVVQDGPSFSARVPNLDAQQSYEIRAFIDDQLGNVVETTTLEGVQLPNGSLDNWWLEKKKIWNPWLETGDSFWDTGNPGSSTLGQSNTLPSDVTWDGQAGKSAELISKFVGLGSIGKFAAGNLFVGEFIAVDGTNGILDFGRPFTTYPTKVKLHYKYKSTAISHTSKDLADLKGRPDSCFIYAAIGDWNAPIRIQTNPKDLKLFSKNDPNIIAYGEYVSAQNTDQYQELVIELDYRDITRKPTYIVLVATASKYGDYFTGGVGSTLFVDNVRLEYDYD